MKLLKKGKMEKFEAGWWLSRFRAWSVITFLICYTITRMHPARAERCSILSRQSKLKLVNIHRRLMQWRWRLKGGWRQASPSQEHVKTRF
jgi:uncharacterized protein YjaG (DUF416 family)